MASKSVFKCNGVRIKTPDEYKIERYSLSDTTRTLDGNAKGDRIARKQKFFFTWKCMDEQEYEAMLEAIWEAPFFFTLEYPTANGQKTIRVYAGAISTPLHRKKGDSWVWKDITVNLIQQ